MGGIDGGIDGGSASGGSGPTPPPPSGPPPPVPDSMFADLVAAMDRGAQSRLGALTVLYQPASGDAVAMAGIFDALYVLSQGDAHAGTETLGPAVFLRLEDIPVDPETDEPTLTIAGLVYRVTERRPDDLGGIVLGLRLVV